MNEAIKNIINIFVSLFVSLISVAGSHLLYYFEKLIVIVIVFFANKTIGNLNKKIHPIGISYICHIWAIFLHEVGAFSDAEKKFKESWRYFSDLDNKSNNFDIDIIELLIDWGDNCLSLNNISEAEKKYQESKKRLLNILRYNKIDIMGKGFNKKLNDFPSYTLQEKRNFFGDFFKNLMSQETTLEEIYLRLLTSRVLLLSKTDQITEIELILQEESQFIKSSIEKNTEPTVYKALFWTMVSGFFLYKQNLIESEEYCYHAWHVLNTIQKPIKLVGRYKFVLLTQWANILLQNNKVPESLEKFEEASRYINSDAAKMLKAIFYINKAISLFKNNMRSESLKTHYKSLVLYARASSTERSFFYVPYFEAALGYISTIKASNIDKNIVKMVIYCHWDILKKAPIDDFLLVSIRVKLLIHISELLRELGQHQESFEKANLAEKLCQDILEFYPNMYKLCFSVYLFKLLSFEDKNITRLMMYSKKMAGVLEKSYWKYPSKEEESCIRMYMAIHIYRLNDYLLNDNDNIPLIINAIHGRKLSRIILDSLDHLEKDKETCYLVQSFITLRYQIYKKGAEFNEIYGIPTDIDSFYIPSNIGNISGQNKHKQEKIIKLKKEYQELITQYNKTRHDLIKSDKYQHLADPFISLEKELLTSRLKPGQVLVILGDIRFKSELKNSLNYLDKVPQCCFFWWMKANGESYAERLDQAILSSLIQQLMTGDFVSYRHQYCMRKRPDDNTEDKARFKGWKWYKQQMQNFLWAPLDKSLMSEVTEIIVISHGRFHLLPLTVGRHEKACPLTHYLSLPFFLHYKSPEVYDGSNRTHIAVQYGGEDLLLAREEGRLLFNKLWVKNSGNLGMLCDQYSFTKITEKQQIGRLYFACHGEINRDQPEFTNLNLGNDKLVTFHDILRMPYRPEAVFLGACVAGQTYEDIDGDPLGPVTAFMLQGARVVVACLTPVPDLYMPLLAYLTEYTAISQQLPLDQALAIAKQHLGTWQTDRDYAHLAEGYREWLQPIITNWLENDLVKNKIDQDDEDEQKNLLLDLAEKVLEKYRYQTIQTDLLNLLKQHRYSTTLKDAVIEAIRSELSHQLMSPPKDVIELLTYSVRAFGKGPDVFH